MKRQMKKVISMVLALAMMLSLVSVSAFAADTGKAGGFGYTVSEDGEVTIVGIDSSLKGESNKGQGTALLIPATVDGKAVASFGNGGILLTNYEGAVLFPERLTKVADGSIYDVGNTGKAFFSFPSTVTEMTKAALASTKNVYYSDSAVATVACQTYGLTAGAAATSPLTISAGEHGSVYPNGVYNVPAGSAETYKVTITADIGYKIASVTVGGSAVEASGNEATISTDLSKGNVEVTFEADPTDTREPSTDPADSYVAPAITSEAVAEGTQLPDNVYDYIADVDGEGTNKYPSTMGVETGTYYAVGGVVYKMVAITQNVAYRSLAEVINAYYENNQWVYGKDYDLIRVYNYNHSYSNGPRPGDFDMYCCYLYKSVGSSISEASSNTGWEGFYEHCKAVATFDDSGMITSATKKEGTDATIQGDVATLMVQAGSTVTVNNLVSTNNTVAYGPSEAANFYGLGSAVLVDGGITDNYKITSGSAYSFNKGTDASSVVLNDPTVIGIQNVLYSVASGTAYVNGGRFFGSSSGGHGFYVGMGGKIAVNADSVLDSNGQAITDTTKLSAATRPALDLGTAVKAEESTNEIVKAAIAADNWETPAAPEYDEKNIPEGTSVLVTADETGTALTTDTGGGVIVANNISATTYGRGCAGVYSIGADESYVFVYNSALHSNMDAALCSASAGYIFAYNTELKGVDGVKTRSGGSGTWAGITVYNSSITCEFEPENYDFYDMATPDDTWPEAYKNWTFADDKSLVNCPMLNLFINKTNASYGSDLSEVMAYWYQDKNVAPQTGEAIAPICSTGSAPIDIHSAYIVNNNYNNYKNDGADNILIAADNAGDGVISFYDCNSSTKWDLTGKSQETTELSGNINISAIVTMTGPDAGSGPSKAPVNFYNSEWTGSVTGYGKGASLTFDATSKWTVDTQWADNATTVVVNNLTLANEGNVVSAKPVTIKVLGTLTINGKEITETTTIGNVTYTFGVSGVFSDMDGAYSWAAEAVDELYYNGIVAGVGDNKYAPGREMTRGELVTVIYNMCGRPEVKSVSTFEDLEADAYYYDAVNWAYSEHIVAGYSATAFGPRDLVTREQAVTIIYQAKEAIGYSTKDPTEETLSEFGDAAQVAKYAKEAMSVLVASEIIAGCPGKLLKPANHMTRAELGCMLDNVFNAIPKSGGGMMPPGFDPSQGGGPGGPGGEGGGMTPPPA